MNDAPSEDVRRTFWGRWKARWLHRRKEKKERRIRLKGDADPPIHGGDQRTKSEWYRY